MDEKLPAILKICQKMNSERDLAALLDLIARESTRLIGAERASIFLVSPDKTELWSKVALGSPEMLRFDARLGIAGAVALGGRTIHVTDAYNDSRFHAGVDAHTGYRTRNLLAAPLRNYNGDTIGAFEVLNRKGGPFTGEDEEILKSLAAHAAIAIETAQLVGNLKRDREQLAEENTQLRRDVEGRFSAGFIVGASDKIQGVLRLIERIRDSSANVLITGESGTGKELVAKAIHYNSPRARRPLVALNCAALPETLLEAELFGVEKGVATGVEARIGKFEAADGGTLFLDEVGDLSLTAQAKILRVLQEKVLDRLGARKPTAVDARVLAATNKDLEAEIRRGTFREDLYYRLKVIHIRTPALREIRDDIPLLANHFLAAWRRESGKEPIKLSAGLVRRLGEMDWPGNARQLENEIKRLAVCARRRVITEEDLAELTPAAPESGSPRRSLAAAVGDFEQRLIREGLEECRHNQVQAAKVLGLSR